MIADRARLESAGGYGATLKVDEVGDDAAPTTKWLTRVLHQTVERDAARFAESTKVGRTDDLGWCSSLQSGIASPTWTMARATSLQ